MRTLKRKMLSKKTISIILAAIVIAGGTMYIGIDKYNKNKVDAEFVAREREYIAKKGNITAGVKGAGILKFEGVKHNFDESVVIGEVFVKEGQQVKVGDKLLSISDEYLNSKLDELNKSLNEAKVGLEQAEGNKQSTVLTNEKSWNDKVQGSKNQYETQKRQLSEAVNDFNGKLNTVNTKLSEVKAQLAELGEETEENTLLIKELKAREEALILEENSLKNELDTAKKNLSNLEADRKNELKLEEQDKVVNNNINNISVKALDKAIASAQAQVNKLQEDINKINKLKEEPILYAKTDGVVATINNTDGSPTNVDGSIVDIGEESKVIAEITISQNDIMNIEEGQEVTLEIASYAAESFKGKVKFVNLKPNTQGNSTTYSAIVELDTTDYKLLEGMTTTAKFIIKEVKDAVTLSNKAIILKDGKQVVNLKNEDGSTTEVEIQTGFSDGKLTEIIGGLNEGDTVVVGG